MTTELTAPDDGPNEKQIERMRKDETFCREAFARGQTGFISGIKWVAHALQAADESGFNLNSGHLDAWTIKCLQRIAAKQMLPEVLLSSVEEPRLMKRVAHYPIKHQRQIVDNEQILVVEPSGGDGNGQKWDTRPMRPDEMTTEIKRQVFDADRIRNEAAQIGYLTSPALERARAVKVAEKVIEVKRDKFIIQPHKETITLSVKDALAMISASK